MIREMTINDIPECAQIFMEAYNKLPWNYNWKPEVAIQYLTEYTDNKHFKGWVIVENGAIAGAMMAHPKSWWTNNQFYIDEIFVSSLHQGKGYGKQLIAFAEDYCKNNQLEMITLMTNKFMPAYKFYNSIDFVKVDQFVFMFKQIE